jgi:DNA-binding NtrC family response regulator
VAGAFTDAKADKPGRIALAEGGTVFLDEVADMSPALQVRLLRVLQEREYEPLGATAPRKADVRVIAATNRKLADQVEDGEFRQDLYFRLNVLKIELPPLAARREDIPLLVDHFLQRLGRRSGKPVPRVADDVLGLLMRYDYPGNVRELENIVEQAVVFARGPTIQPEDVRLPESSGEARPSLGDGKSCLKKALRDPEKRLLLEALSRTGGNKKRAAELLGISRSALYEKLRRHGVSTKK